MSTRDVIFNITAGDSSLPLVSFRFLLWDLDSRAYSYIVEVSQDRLNWIVVFDATQMLCRSWQTIKFPLQPVTFIRITGTGNTANDVFHIVHLECPAAVLDPTEDTLVEEASQENVLQSSSQVASSQPMPSGSGGGDADGSNLVGSNNRSGNSGSENGFLGQSVYVDAVSALRYQRPRLLEVEEPFTPSSSLVADLSTISLHSEATLDATGTETTGDASQPPFPLPHHQRRRRRRYHHGIRQQQQRQHDADDEESYVRGTASATNPGVPNTTGASLPIVNSLHYFLGTSRATSSSSVNRNDPLEVNRLNSLNIGERIQQDLPLLRSSSGSSLDSSGNAPASEQS